MDFLRTAEVVSVKSIPEGVTRPLKILLERDGFRMHAAFRHVDMYKKQWKSADGIKLHFRDSCRFEIAAYLLGRMFSIENIPPVVDREIEGRKGTLQAWVEQAMTESLRAERQLEAPAPKRWTLQYQVMWLFDNLAYNDDRNKGNILIDSDWNLWMIDATRAFRPVSRLKSAKVIRHCERRTWDLLQAVPDAVLKQQLGPYLDSFEISALLKRRRLLVEHLQDQIRSRGEAAVLFDRY